MNDEEQTNKRIRVIYLSIPLWNLEDNAARLLFGMNILSCGIVLFAREKQCCGFLN